MKILISGASGMIGRSLTSAMPNEGHAVGRLVRPGTAVLAGDVRWEPKSATVDVEAMEGVDVVVHLAGASIGESRWTPQRKALIRSSRVDSTRLLVDAISHMRRKPRVLLCASAIGYYGNRGDELLTESSGCGNDFLALLARDWEGEAARAAHAGLRTVMLRFGVILSAAGGALPRMITPFKLGLGGRFGSGSQWMSWIALDDVVGIIRVAINNEEVAGPVNLVSPAPVQNAEFAHILAATLHRPSIIPVPAFALRVALGEMADPLLLYSQRVRPERSIQNGYRFQFDDLSEALQAILAKS
jgi:uncharacterized protein